MIKILVNGATGRMGQAVLLAAAGAKDIKAVAGIAGSSHDPNELGGIPLYAELNQVTEEFDVLIDFSSPEGQTRAVGFCLEKHRPLVSGTTGLGERQSRALMETDWDVPVVFSPNMSAGVALMRSLVAKAAAALGNDVEVEIVEAHHRHKIDSPSGTALNLGRAVAESRGQPLEELACHGRQGRVGPRKPGEIGFHALRGGDTIGDHCVVFFGEGERLEIAHQSTSRRAYAEGALRAARWVLEQAPGAYRMSDVLDLS